MNDRQFEIPAAQSPRLSKQRIIRHERLNRDIVRLRISAAELVGFSLPGQFVNIKVGQGYFPLLRRPFSIHRVDRNAGWLEILFKILGPGTEWLSRCSVGDELDLLGPLGNAFQVQEEFRQAVLIAGGLGIAPLLFLAQELRQQQMAVTLLYGNKSQTGCCCQDEFNELGVQSWIATEDGSLGFIGKVTDLALAHPELWQMPRTMIYACGPNAMLQQVNMMAAAAQIPCQVSLETMMACGFGVCLGCVVKSATATNSFKYVCKDGPVFFSSEIDFSD